MYNCSVFGIIQYLIHPFHFLQKKKNCFIGQKNKLPLTKNTAKAHCFLLNERQKGAKRGSAIIAENHILLQEKHSDFEL